MTGQKLVGTGGCSVEGDVFFETVFGFTNPDCVGQITIEQVSIIKEDGTVIHEGPLLDSYGFPLPQQTLGPHEAGFIALRYYVAWKYGLGLEDFRDFPPGGYTVEIFWTKSHKEGLPLMGTVTVVLLELVAGGNEIVGTPSGWSTEMVNMEQELELEDVEPDVVDPPEVATRDATNIDSNSATLNGNLNELGTASAVEVSFEWGVQSGVYPNETTPQEMTSTGTYGAIIDGLPPAKTYYFRAEAVGDGMSYGTELSFTTPTPLSTEMNVGSTHFRSEIAEFYLQIASQGEPVAATTIDGRLYKPDGSAETVAFESVPDATGLYKAELAVPPDAPIGQYVVRVEATYESESTISKGTSIDGFLLSKTLTGWDAWLVDIRDGVATIQTDIGVMSADITSINAKLTGIDGNIATIQTDIGTIRADLSDIGTKVDTIEGGVAIIQTDVGIISGRVTGIEDGVATIETDVGVIQEDVSDILDDTGTIASRSSYMLPILVVAGVGTVAGIVAVMVYRRRQE